MTKNPETTIAAKNSPLDRRIRKPEVLALTGYETRTLYRRIAAGLFPRPVKDGRMSFWWLSEVLQNVGQKSVV